MASEETGETGETGGRARGALILGAVVALGLGIRHFRAGSEPKPALLTSSLSAPASPVKAPSTPRPAPLKAAPSGSAAPAVADPASLRGTDEDGSLSADENGNLVVGPGILAFFDYHLSATGELGPAAIRARILARIRQSLLERAAGQAATLLDRYLAYREATKQLREDGDTQARLEALHRLRHRIFGEDDAERLFGDQERADAVAVAGQKLQQDPSLTPEERAARLAKLEESLPEAVRAARAQSILPIREQQEEAEMRAAGKSDAEIRSYRVATVGEAAANRLDSLDAQRDAWKQKLQTWKAARAALAAQFRDPEARKAAEAKLLEASFTPEEQLRVKALDALAAESATGE